MKTILVLDENLGGGKALSMMLRRKEFRVYQVGQEAAALTTLSLGCSIDLVLEKGMPTV